LVGEHRCRHIWALITGASFGATFSLGTLILAIIGAVILLFIVNLVRRTA
jgi:uncharacterized membrane protein YeaQ/YmgE (transglycosylase-associated protein family)